MVVYGWDSVYARMAMVGENIDSLFKVATSYWCVVDENKWIGEFFFVFPEQTGRNGMRIIKQKKNIKTNNDTQSTNQYLNDDGGDDDDIQNGYTIPRAIIFSSVLDRTGINAETPTTTMVKWFEVFGLFRYVMAIHLFSANTNPAKYKKSEEKRAKKNNERWNNK